ncbi:hypothetical protein Avbf_01443, partial [Armadillidium vulgare]
IYIYIYILFYIYIYYINYYYYYFRDDSRAPIWTTAASICTLEIGGLHSTACPPGAETALVLSSNGAYTGEHHAVIWLDTHKLDYCIFDFCILDFSIQLDTQNLFVVLFFIIHLTEFRLRSENETGNKIF